MNDILNHTFDVEVVTPISHTEIITVEGRCLVPHEIEEVDKNVDYDYETTRNNLHTLLTQGHEALAKALEIAKASEHPTAFEVVGNLMKQLSEVNYQLLELTEKRLKLKAQAQSKGGDIKNVTNNTAVFVGSTDELNKMIQRMGDK